MDDNGKRKTDKKKGRRIYSSGFHAKSNFFLFITSNVDLARARGEMQYRKSNPSYIHVHISECCFKERFFHKKSRRSFPREEMKRLISILSCVIKLVFLKTNHEYVDTWVLIILVT